MNRSLQDSIAAAILEAESAARSPNSYGFLPGIIKTLRVMLNDDTDTMSQRDRERRAGGLGRLVTDNFAFSESPLGTKLLELADQFASSEG
jgi:hypothetical protein